MKKKNIFIGLLIGLAVIMSPTLTSESASAEGKCVNDRGGIVACDDPTSVGPAGPTSSPPASSQGKKCGGADTSIIECGGSSEDAIINLIKMVIQIMTAGIGVLAVGATIAGGILYASAGGSPENIKKAASIWTNTVIGLILFAFLVAITNFLIPGGVF